jgi:proline dehydrogenase
MRLRFDMEESALVPGTLALYRRLREEGVDNVGVVLQTYLRRSEADLADLLPLGLNVRLVKGAYLEPAAVAYPDKRDVDAAYVRMLTRCLAEAEHTAIATHDPAILRTARVRISSGAIAPERYEFQMLYGIALPLQREIVDAGYPLRIAAPYGPTWFPYLMRRLAERPANLGFFLRNAVSR